VEIIVIKLLILGNHIPMLSLNNNYADSSRVAMDKIGVVSFSWETIWVRRAPMVTGEGVLGFAHQQKEKQVV
jgi:hypothetical protein